MTGEIVCTRNELVDKLTEREFFIRVAGPA